MAGENTFSTLNGHFTEAYADALKMLVPKVAKLANKIRFVEAEKHTGNLYHQPVALTRENGVIFNSDGSAFSLTDPGPGNAAYGDAQIRGTEIVVVSRLSYAAAARALGGKKQFVNETELLVKQNAESHGFNLELSTLYGQTSIGATSDVTAAGTSGTLVITAATWAPGIWYGAVGRSLDVYATLGTAAATNTNAAIVVTGVNFSTRTVSFSCASGDAAGLDALTTSVIFRRGSKSGAATYKECAGVDAILSNTGSMFNIDASVYDLWKATSYSAGSAALNMQKIQSALATPVNAGLDQDVTCILSPRTWADVMSDMSALRMFDSSYTSRNAENGAETLTFYSQNGKIEFMPHILCKEGEAFLVPLDEFKRIGSTDVTFRQPGMPSEQLLLQLPSNAGYEIRSYSDSAYLCNTPAKAVKITGIVNTT